MHFTIPTLGAALIALTLTVFATAATLASASSSSSSSRRSLHHGSMARRARQGKLAASNTNTDNNLTKRQSGSGRGSWYDPSTGAGHCGRTFQKSDPIVAVNSAQFKLSDCYKWISVTANGETHQAQITDSCPSCPYGALDFSPGFFQQFAPLSQGLFQMTWSLGGGSSDDDDENDSSSSSSQQQQPKTTAQKQKTTYSQPSPTSTRARSTSSSQTPTPTSTSTVASSSSTSSASSTSASSSAASSSATSSTSTPTAAANNLQVLSQAVNGFLAMAKGQQQQQ